MSMVACATSRGSTTHTGVESGTTPTSFEGRPFLTADEDASLRYAESVLTAECMQRQGFTYQPLDLSSVRSTLQMSYRLAEYEAFPFDAASEGLNYVDTRSSGLIVDPNIEFIRSLTQEQLIPYGDTLQGFVSDSVTATALGLTLETPRGGCMSEARASLYGSLEASLMSMLVAANLNSTAHQRTMVAPTVSAALASWQACMSDSGFEFVEFHQSRSVAASNPSESVEIASADARCTTESALGTVYRSVYAEQISQLTEENFEVFEEVQRARDEALTIAMQLIGN